MKLNPRTGIYEHEKREKKPRHDEQHLQMAVVSYLRLQYPDVLFTISPGGLITNSRTGGKAKKMGYTPGTPDLMIFAEGHYKWTKYASLFLELKIDKEQLSSVQEDWLKKLNQRGYLAVCCHGFEEAKAVIDGYLKK